jgi:hypothetical protein
VVALGVLGLVAWPAWQKLQQSDQQWQSLKAQAETLPLLRRRCCRARWSTAFGTTATPTRA